MRVDGLFLKLFSDEDQELSGRWIEGPLLVGPRAIRSYPAFGRVDELNAAVLAGAQDAVLVPPEGAEPRIVRDTPFEPLWHLMAFARDGGAPESAAFDWAAAPELDQILLDELVEDGERWRGQPIRIPMSRIQDARVKRAGENPARIDEYTEGWIGNTTWKNVLHFKAPFADYDLRLRDYAYGRGFFLHNFAYESAGKGLRVAPVFVLSSITRHDAEPDPLWSAMAYVLVGLAIVLLIALGHLIARDKRKAMALQQEMARRRQARRARQEQSPVGSTPTS